MWKKNNKFNSLERHQLEKPFRDKDIIQIKANDSQDTSRYVWYEHIQIVNQKRISDRQESKVPKYPYNRSKGVNNLTGFRTAPYYFTKEISWLPIKGN